MVANLHFRVGSRNQFILLNDHLLVVGKQN